MGVVSEDSEYWSPKGDNVICSYFGEGEVGRERGKEYMCVRVCTCMCGIVVLIGTRSWTHDSKKGLSAQFTYKPDHDMMTLHS